MTVSIKDVADRCSVSATTVSRALNNSKEISDKTRKRILKTCEEMGYVPNASARNLILNRTNMIGLVIPDIGNQYYAYVSKGVSSYVQKEGYGLVLCNSDRDRVNERKYLQFLMERRVDGIILIPQISNRTDLKLNLAQIPIVLADNLIQDLNVSYVGNDNYFGARKIISHMIKQGYKRIGAILGSSESSASNERLQAYNDVLLQNGVIPDPEIQINSNATYEDGFRLTGALLAMGVDAIFCINDTVAMGVMKYCYQKGVQIPGDIGIAGYDDIEQAQMLSIPLTTVHQRKYKLGEIAAKLLIEEIRDPDSPKQKVILQPELVIRKSCKE